MSDPREDARARLRASLRPPAGLVAPHLYPEEIGAASPKPTPADLFSDDQEANIHRTTPATFLAVLRQFAGYQGVGLDPCSNPRSIVRAAVEWHGPLSSPCAKCAACTPHPREACTDSDGLQMSWEGYGLAYVNNPYTTAGHRAWGLKMNYEAAEGVEIICLTQAAPTTNWFQASEAKMVCWWKGRLAFDGLSAGAKFGSAVLYHGTRPDWFRSVFKAHGKVTPWG